MKCNHTGAIAARLPHRSLILLLLGLVLFPMLSLGPFWSAAACRRFSSILPNLPLAPPAVPLQKTLTTQKPRFRLSSLLTSLLKSSIFSPVQASLTNPDLTVHEWGTFTSIAGSDGQAMDWLPLTGSTDLPSFVEHFRDVSFKGGLRGTVRMETPVLYFYSPRETTVSVKVSFAKGLITEWYPHASAVASLDPRRDITLYQKHTQGSIAWNSVHIEPGGSNNFRSDEQENHYYAARETSSAAVRVITPDGEQLEKFLFYRGVSTFSVPLSALLTPDGSVLLRNRLRAEIPALILFERRGEKVGFRFLGPLADQGTFALPEPSGSVDSLFSDLEGILVSQGLYPDEAHAMIETWKNSWFEEGARLFYLVPRGFVDSVLPLTIVPASAQITRVFVGRLELITPATEEIVESAFASNDRATLAKYRRFLEPILSSMIQNSTDPLRQRRLAEYFNSVYASIYAQARIQEARGQLDPLPPLPLKLMFTP
jgi:hypothetical protein